MALPRQTIVSKVQRASKERDWIISRDFMLKGMRKSSQGSDYFAEMKWFNWILQIKKYSLEQYQIAMFSVRDKS